MNVKNEVVKLVKDNPVVALAAVIAIAAFIIYAIVFIPMMNEMKIKYVECRRLENDVTNARKIIDYAKTMGKPYGGRILISEKEAATGIDEFTEHAKERGIEFIAVKPQNTISKEGMVYKIMPIELELEADDKQFVDFLGSIDELKKAIVTVNSMDITPDESNNARLLVKMTIYVYLSAREDLS
ncbi:MAG: type 4a pilus biogenesis protein PilO [Candidatus Omnitrophota bacterium]|nr:type 4a pilus biogenesis protein PilO [Candidatus Omnitrophota bacterium]